MCGEDEKHCILKQERNAWFNFDMELPFGTDPFKLEHAVCSHGLFMMPPNKWDPLSKTLTRPFHSSSSSSFLISISQRSQSLAVRVHNTHFLSPQQQRHVTAQVSRMLRLSESEEKAVRGFTTMHDHHHPNRSFRGRVFRSPTLFEDMVKCILLCNCQWPRTLSMAQALCELQLELQNGSPRAVAVVGNPKPEAEAFIPKPPAAKESRRNKVLTNGILLKRKLDLEWEVEGNLQMDHKLDSSSNATLLPTDNGDSEELRSDDSCHQFSNGQEEYFSRTGNFPSPSELANLDESFLAKRCGLGYRARYIRELAHAIVEGKIQLGQFEELSKDANLSSYKQLEDQLKDIRGFGPYTRANVLMCLGYYHVIPTDSETIRHLKQVHSRNTTCKTIERDLEEIYGKYEPYQFLAFWSEIWEFYETRFGKMNEMHSSDYKLITASNMRTTSETTKKRKRPSRKGRGSSTLESCFRSKSGGLSAAMGGATCRRNIYTWVLSDAFPNVVHSFPAIRCVECCILISGWCLWFSLQFSVCSLMIANVLCSCKKIKLNCFSNNGSSPPYRLYRLAIRIAFTDWPSI